MENLDQSIEIVIICDISVGKTVSEDHEWEN